MRVAQIAPLFESVPPKQYGGTERVVSYLTEELVRLGHQVTLFASGDSQTSAELVPSVPRSLRLGAGREQGVIDHMLMIEQVRKRAHEFDIIHWHTDYLHYPVVRSLNTPSLTTLHGRLDLPELTALYDEFIETAVVSISDAQRKPLPWLNWKGTVHHGLPKDLLQFKPRSKGYAAFLGRMSPEKAPEKAIEIAKRFGIPLKMAAKVGVLDREFFNESVKPLIDCEPEVEFIGEISDDEKSDFLGNASVLLFPINWPEPFGLVMIEAMACGTPVLAYPGGSVPEIIKNGISGFVVNSVEEGVKAMEDLMRLDRSKCREDFEERFSVERMTGDYLALFQNMIREEAVLSLPRRTSLGWESWKTSSSTQMTSI
jgi:glycosyltransferase involved in cell wall biosynthesis